MAVNESIIVIFTALFNLILCIGIMAKVVISKGHRCCDPVPASCIVDEDGKTKLYSIIINGMELKVKAKNNWEHNGQIALINFEFGNLENNRPYVGGYNDVPAALLGALLIPCSLLMLYFARLGLGLLHENAMPLFFVYSLIIWISYLILNSSIDAFGHNVMCYGEVINSIAYERSDGKYSYQAYSPVVRVNVAGDDYIVCSKQVYSETDYVVGSTIRLSVNLYNPYDCVEYNKKAIFDAVAPIVMCFIFGGVFFITLL